MTTNTPTKSNLRPDLWDGRLSNRDRDVLIQVAEQYQLDPLTGDLMMLRGKVYITAAGLQKLAIRDPNFEGCEIDIVQADWEKNFYVIKARLWKKGCSHPFEDYGDADPSTSSLRGHNLFRHAITRARARAMRSAFAVPFCSVEELSEDDVNRMKQEDQQQASASVQKPAQKPAPRQSTPSTPKQRPPVAKPASVKKQKKSQFELDRKRLGNSPSLESLTNAWRTISDSKQLFSKEEFAELSRLKGLKESVFKLKAKTSQRRGKEEPQPIASQVNNVSDSLELFAGEQQTGTAPAVKPSQGGQHRSPAPRPPAPQEEQGESQLYSTWKSNLQKAEDIPALQEAWNIARQSRDLLQGDEFERLAVIKDECKLAFEGGEA